MQLNLFPVKSDWRPQALFVPWAGAKRVAIDIEARDPTLKELGSGAGRRPNSYVVGVSYAIEGGPSEYLPFRHKGGDNLPEEQVLGYLRDQAKTFDGDLVGANLQYDLDFLGSDGVEFKKLRYVRDVLIADPLICELHERYNLDTVAGRWGLPGKDETLLREAAKQFKLDPKKDLWKLPARYVGGYATRDVTLPLELLRRQEREIDEQDLWDVYNLESKVLPVLLKMRRRGVRIHLGRLERIEAWALAEETEALKKIAHHTSYNVRVGDVWKADVLEQVLLRIGVKVGRTKTGKPNIDKLVLAGIDHPVADALEWARKVNKLRTTFAGSIRDHLTPDGRIHCSYNQLKKTKDEDEDGDETEGAAYGRLSCVDPNLQQQPSRDEFAPMWRAIYLPEEGDLWAACDYSQQEPRMAVHYACKSEHLIGHEAWLKAIEARDKYRNDPKADNHQMMADMANIKRKFAKEIFLGLCYGMGGAKLCRKLGLPTRWVVQGPRGQRFDVLSPEGQVLLAQGAKRWEAAGLEGQALLDKFDQAVPFIRLLARAAEQRAKAVGYITTLDGRRCRFPKDPNGNFDWTYKALNRLIQGSSAGQMKKAMVALDEAGFTILIQVHDEVGNSVKNEAEAQAAAQIMLDCCPLEVPSKVDIEIGESWGGSMGWKEAA